MPLSGSTAQRTFERRRSPLTASGILEDYLIRLLIQEAPASFAACL